VTLDVRRKISHQLSQIRNFNETWTFPTHLGGIAELTDTSVKRVQVSATVVQKLEHKNISKPDKSHNPN